MWGGGRGIANLPGNPERGEDVTLASQYCELESHLILARKNRGLESHLSSISYFGISIWRGFIAGKFGRFIQRFLRLKLKHRKEK